MCPKANSLLLDRFSTHRRCDWFQPGALDKFKLDTKSIIEVVARDTESKGLNEDAVRLYDLAMVSEAVTICHSVQLGMGENDENVCHCKSADVRTTEIPGHVTFSFNLKNTRFHPDAANNLKMYE